MTKETDAFCCTRRVKVRAQATQRYRRFPDRWNPYRIEEPEQKGQLIVWKERV